MDLWVLAPPNLLPCIPRTALIHTPRNYPGDCLAHGFGRFSCIALELDTGWIYDLIPEVGGNLKVLLAQFCPSIELSVTNKNPDTCKTYF
jgi:hypothetical protein